MLLSLPIQQTGFTKNTGHKNSNECSFPVLPKLLMLIYVKISNLCSPLGTKMALARGSHEGTESQELQAGEGLSSYQGFTYQHRKYVLLYLSYLLSCSVSQGIIGPKAGLSHPTSQ